MSIRLSQKNVEQMFKYIFEYCGFEVEGFDPKNRIIAYPSPNNQFFIFSMRKDGQTNEGVRVPELNLYTPPEELFYCARVILGDKAFNALKKELYSSTFQEILEILKPELWERYCTNYSRNKFIIYCSFTKDGTLRMVTDWENIKDAAVWYDFYEDGSADIKNLETNQAEEDIPPETFNNLMELAYELMDKSGTIGRFFNKLSHKGEYEFSYRDCLKLYDEFRNEYYSLR